jgi:probable HAF family extracellular repeat protein
MIDLGGTSSFANGINAQRQVCGTSFYSDVFTNGNFLQFAFLWENGVMTNLDTLGGPTSRAFGINDSTQVVGTWLIPNGASHAFLWTRGGMDGVPSNPQMRDLRTLGGLHSTANDIDVLGKIVGVSDTGNGERHAFLWTRSGVDGVPNNPQMHDLGTLGGQGSFAAKSNISGQIVGSSTTSTSGSFFHATLWDNNKIIDLGTLGGSESFAEAINSLGQVVGRSLLSGDAVLQALLWQNGVMVDLNDLIPPDSGWDLGIVFDINDAGEIVGSGFLKNDPERLGRAFPLTPALSDCETTLPLGWPTASGASQASQDYAEFNGSDASRRVYKVCDPTTGVCQLLIKPHYHTGMDLASPVPATEPDRKQEVFAAAQGEVVAVCPKVSPKTGCVFNDTQFSTNEGNHSMQGVVILKHTVVGSNTVESNVVSSLYAHLGTVGPCRPNECVEQGRLIGATGGLPDGHLHFEVKSAPVLSNPLTASGTCIDPVAQTPSNVCFGYTLVNPSTRGYFDAVEYLHLLDKSGFPKAVTLSDEKDKKKEKKINVRSGPGAFGSEYRVVGKAEEGSYTRLSASLSSIQVIFAFPERCITISSLAEEIVMPDQPIYHSQVLDHLGLIAGRFDALSIGDVLDQAPHQNPEMRDLTVGEAAKAMVLNGLGCINQALYLVPRFFHKKPTARLISPRVVPAQLNDDALGRALDTL